ncbi:hypothetical protein ABZ826_22390 [Streptomyces sp. NPDC047515]|uniref:hypothetical protein n=1 Tax=Streptomyces sp. NPDC047515 TaxID=3155380 RepID=UPI0033DF4ED1
MPYITKLRATRHAERDTGHELRELLVVAAPTTTGSAWAYPAQYRVARIGRLHTDAKVGRLTRQNVYAVTDVTAWQACPQQLGLARSQWTSRTGFSAAGTSPSLGASSRHPVMFFAVLQEGRWPPGPA